MKRIFTALREDFAAIRRLHKQLSKARRRLLGLHIANAAILICQLATPFAVGAVIERLGHGEGFLAVMDQAAIALTMMAVTLLMSTFTQIHLSREAISCANELRERMFVAATHRPASQASEQSASDLHARFTGDIGLISHLWPAGMATIARHLIMLVLAAAALAYISWPLVLSISAFLPVAMVIFSGFSGRIRGLAAQAQASLGMANGVLLESLQSVNQAQPAGSLPFHRRRLMQALQESGHRLHRARSSGALLGLSLGALPLLVSTVVWTIGASQINAGQLSAADLVAFVLVLSVLYGPINGLFSAASALAFEKAALVRILSVFDIEPQSMRAVTVPPVLDPISVGPQIDVRDLNFSYGNRVLFNAISLTVAAGTCARLEGSNGSGKSTLMALFFDARGQHERNIRWNGRPMSDVSVDERARLTGYLPQDILLYSDTLRNNIALGRPLDDEDIVSLAKTLGMADLLGADAAGLDAMLTETGSNLSGGQRQRVGLLRTLIGRPRILLLDEPEKNLDQQALASLVEYLRLAKGDCTCILATHSTAFDPVVDQTICMDDLVAVGAPHD
jgi:ABC-type bacteriocin/lantibiotic exporter with double-glycine peptidase domain